MKKKLNQDLGRKTIEEYKSLSKIPLILVLDNIRSQHNVGAVFRTSDAFLIEAIYLCGITATPPNNEIRKSALGAELSVDWLYFNSTLEAILSLKEKGVEVVALEQTTHSISFEDLKINRKHRYALILGNEVKGIEDDVLLQCDRFVEIDQYGTKHSLNVSVAAGIAIWEFYKSLK